jgi:hypothetical protein
LDVSLTSILILVITVVATAIFVAGVGFLDRKGELTRPSRQFDNAAMQAAMNEALAGPLAEFQRVKLQLDSLAIQLAEARHKQDEMRALLEMSGHSLPGRVSPDFNMPDIGGLFSIDEVILNLPERRKQRTQQSPLALANYTATA